MMKMFVLVSTLLFLSGNGVAAQDPSCDSPCVFPALTDPEICVSEPVVKIVDVIAKVNGRRETDQIAEVEISLTGTVLNLDVDAAGGWCVEEVIYHIAYGEDCSVNPFPTGLDGNAKPSLFDFMEEVDDSSCNAGPFVHDLSMLVVPASPRKDLTCFVNEPYKAGDHVCIAVHVTATKDGNNRKLTFGFTRSNKNKNEDIEACGWAPGESFPCTNGNRRALNNNRKTKPKPNSKPKCPNRHVCAEFVKIVPDTICTIPGFVTQKGALTRFKDFGEMYTGTGIHYTGVGDLGQGGCRVEQKKKPFYDFQGDPMPFTVTYDGPADTLRSQMSSLIGSSDFDQTADLSALRAATACANPGTLPDTWNALVVSPLKNGGSGMGDVRLIDLAFNGQTLPAPPSGYCVPPGGTDGNVAFDFSGYSFTAGTTVVTGKLVLCGDNASFYNNNENDRLELGFATVTSS